MENISLDVLPKDGNRVLRALESGNMVIARSKNDFLYMLDFDGMFHLFSHTPGAPGGGQKQFPKDEQHTATMRKIIDIADKVFLAEFDKDMNIYGVMYSVEQGILSMYPGEDRDNDEDVEFTIPGGNKS